METYFTPCSSASIVNKVNNRSTRTRCKICLKLTRKTPERRQWRLSGVVTVNFEHISNLLLVFLLVTLGSEKFAGTCLHHVYCHSNV